MAGTGIFELSWIAVLAAAAFAGLVCPDAGSLLANDIVTGPAFATAGISGVMPRPGSNAGWRKIAGRRTDDF
jgi:hypothetical protein